MPPRTPTRRARFRQVWWIGVVAAAGLLLGWGALGAAASTPSADPTPAIGSTATSAASPTTEPTPTGSPTPTTFTPEPTPTPDASPTPTSTATPSPSPSATATPTPTPTPTPTATPVPAVPPAITTSTVGLETVLIALAVLLAGGLLLWMLLRRKAAPPPPIGIVEGLPEGAPVVLDAMAALGSTMIDCGYPVGLVRSTLEDMARANGIEAQIVVYPTSILVSTDDGLSAQTRVVTAGDSTVLLHQVDEVDRVAGVARSRPRSAAVVRRRLESIRMLPPPFSRLQRIGAYALLSAALSVLLGSSWPGVGLAAVLGVGVGALLLATETLGPVHRALVVVGASLGVSIIVLVVARTFDPGVLPAAVAPLIMLLPGGQLTIGVVELATGDIISGAARVAAGAMRLLLLSTGIVAAAALVGVPSITETAWPLGPFVPWIAVAAFGLGISVYQCARAGSIGWIMVVLYVAYGAQVIGDLFFNGVLSALVGAAAMTPMAVIVARQRTGPPALVSFLPAFWMLVPGALGLVGVASLLEGVSSGLGTVVTMIATMVSIALGVLLGLAVTGSVRGFRNSPAGGWIQEEFGADAPREPDEWGGVPSGA